MYMRCAQVAIERRGFRPVEIVRDLLRFRLGWRERYQKSGVTNSTDTDMTVSVAELV